MKNQRHIFISYKSSEAKFSLRIAADLRNSGVKIWMDRLDMGISPSQDWRSSIENALTTKKCNGMIAILSPDYLSSSYCKVELARADRLGIPIYPIILSSFPDERWPLEVERLQYIDFQEWEDEVVYQNGIGNLLDVLKVKFPSQFTLIPDPETRYLTNLIAELETRQGVANYVELEGETSSSITRPLPLIDQETGYRVLINKEKIKSRKSNTTYVKKISAVAETYPSFVLTGAPGAGKTTVIRNMALDFARRNLDHPRALPIPMIVYLPQWQDNWSLEEFLKAKWPLQANPLDLLKKGDLILFLDGLNEMGAEKMSKVIELRSWLLNSSVSSQIIVTCRADDYNEDLQLGDLPVVSIKQLSASQISQFAKRYLGKRAKKFLQQVTKDESGVDIDKRGLLQLISNPYFLTAFMIIYDSAPNEELPKNSGTLFEKLTLAVWTREEQRRSTRISFETAKSEFARLAFAMIDSDMPVEVSREYALLFLSDKDLLSFGQSASFLISHSNGVRFYHQLIQEYFAAIGLARVGISHVKLDKKPLQVTSGYSSKYTPFLEDIFKPYSNSEYRRSSKWDQVIISLCGFTEHPEEIIKKVANIDPLLAVDCLASGVGISLATVRDGFIEAANDENVTLRKAALSALVKVGGEQSIPFLAKALDDKESDVRKLATNLLTTFQKSAIPYFLQHLKTAGNDNVTLSIQALASIGVAAISVLREVAINEPDITIKIRACNALGKIKHRDSGVVLASLLRSKSEQVVKVCIDGLGNIGDADSILALISFFDETPETNIDLRSLIVKSLGNIGSPQVIPILINLIGHESWIMHSAALLALRKISTPESLSSVKTFDLLNTRSGEPRKTAIQKVYEKYGVMGLIHGLRSKSFWDIAYKLAEVPENEFKIFLKMSNSDSHHVKAMLAFCVGKRNNKKHGSKLISLISDKSPFVRGVAIESLGKLKNKSAVSKISKKLYDPSRVYSNSKTRVCDNAAMALLNIGTDKAIKELKTWALIEIEGRILDGQTAPLIVLKKVGDNRAVPRLSKILGHKKSWISRYALEALQAIGTPDALNALKNFDNKNKK